MSSVDLYSRENSVNSLLHGCEATYTVVACCSELAIEGMHEAFHKASHFLRELQIGIKSESVATRQ